MRRILLLLAAAAALFALTGCIDYDEVLTLNADGSGTVKIHVVMDKTFMNEMQAMAEKYGGEPSGSSPAEEICSEEEMRAALEKMGSGLEIVSYKETETEETLSYDISFKFSDYEDFQDLEEVCADENGQGESSTEWEFSFEKQPDGTWLYRRYFNGSESSDESGAGEEMDEGSWAETEDESEEPEEEVDLERLAEAMKNLGEAMEGFVPAEEGEGGEKAEAFDFGGAMEGFAQSMQKAAEDAKNHTVRIVVNLPGEVVESNGTSVSGGTVTWEYTLDQMQAAPDIFEARVKP